MSREYFRANYDNDDDLHNQQLLDYDGDLYNYFKDTVLSPPDWQEPL